MGFIRNNRPALYILLFGLAVLFPIQAYAYPYNVTADYSVASSPQDVVVADFNNDGRDDVAVAGYTTGRISVLLNQAHGLLGTAVNYSVGNVPWGIAAADFNGDGYQDLVVSNSGDDNVSFLENDGDGTFAAAVNYKTGGKPMGLAIGDFNGDGDDDIAVANMDDDTFSMLSGNGDGTFNARWDFATGVDPATIIVDDFNNDNRQDVAVANSGAFLIIAYNAGGVSILTGRGDGTFNAKHDFPAAKGVTAIASGDFNGDGDKDVAAATRNSSQVGVFMGKGDGTLDTVVNYSVGTYPMGVTAFDMNSDGVLDIITADNSANTLSFYEGVGDGTFTNYTTTGAGSSPAFIATGDINQDGKTDLAVSNRGVNTVRTYLDNSPPTVTSLSPSLVYVGSAATTVTVNGTGFEPDASVEVDSVTHTTTYINTTQVSFQFSATELKAVGTRSIQVYNPAASEHSNASIFTIAHSITGLLPIALESPVEPDVGFKVIINSGALSTAQNKVSLKFITKANEEPQATRFAVSNKEDFSGASIEELANVNPDAYSWDICAGLSGSCSAGKHVVYVKFYTAWGQPSKTIQANISYLSSAVQSTEPASAAVPRIVSEQFLRSLRMGDVGDDVKRLQQFLNSKGFYVSATGPGSVGNETNYFGAKTFSAVILFQEAHAAEILAPLGLTSGTGYFGTATRQYMNSIMQ